MGKDHFVYAAGAVGLGLTGLAFGDFALQWQPVPQSLPLRTPLAYLCALLLIAVSVAIFLHPRKFAGLTACGVLFALWTVLLKTPAIIVAPWMLGTWLGFAEIASLAIAGLMAASSLSGGGGSRTFLALRIGYGFCAIIFGLSHYVYVDITASMVPEWLPAPHFWAYATGTGHLAAGMAIASGLLARLAATLLALMMGSFALLIQVPDILANPSGHLEWTILFISITLSGAAWLVRSTLIQTSEDAQLYPASVAEEVDSQSSATLL